MARARAGPAGGRVRSGRRALGAGMSTARQRRAQSRAEVRRHDDAGAGGALRATLFGPAAAPPGTTRAPARLALEPPERKRSCARGRRNRRQNGDAAECARCHRIGRSSSRLPIRRLSMRTLGRKRGRCPELVAHRRRRSAGDQPAADCAGEPSASRGRLLDQRKTTGTQGSNVHFHSARARVVADEGDTWCPPRGVNGSILRRSTGTRTVQRLLLALHLLANSLTWGRA